MCTVVHEPSRGRWYTQRYYLVHRYPVLYLCVYSTSTVPVFDFSRPH